ncbi:hypothetical protein MRX96_043028 [Rhipicephalus microplus]
MYPRKGPRSSQCCSQVHLGSAQHRPGSLGSTRRSRGVAWFPRPISWWCSSGASPSLDGPSSADPRWFRRHARGGHLRKHHHPRWETPVRRAATWLTSAEFLKGSAWLTRACIAKVRELQQEDVVRVASGSQRLNTGALTSRDSASKQRRVERTYMFEVVEPVVSCLRSLFEEAQNHRRDISSAAYVAVVGASARDLPSPPLYSVSNCGCKRSSTLRRSSWSNRRA